MEELFTVKVFGSRIEAEVAKGLLEANGIKSVIVSDDAGGMRPFPLQYNFGVELKVKAADKDRAKSLLSKLA